MHDASNAIATLVATRAARPSQAILLATVFNLLGPLLLGAAVADTIGGIVTVSPSVAIAVIGSGLAAATAWNLATWRLGLPSSSGHALVGGLVGAAVVEGGVHAVNWGGMDGLHPVGVFGTLIALAVSPGSRRARRAAGDPDPPSALAQRATQRWHGTVQGGQWVTSAALSFSHGANDAQKSVGVIAALLLADGHIDSLSAPTWVIVACSAALTAGTSLGGWRIIRTVGRRIYRIHPLEGLSSQTSSAGVIFGASLLGRRCRPARSSRPRWSGSAPARRRLRHVNWELVRQIGLAWLITLPASAALGAPASRAAGRLADMNAETGAGSFPRRRTSSGCFAGRRR